MRVMVLGADGYLGWPTVMHLSARGHEVIAVDSYVKREMLYQASVESLIPVPKLDVRTSVWEAITRAKVPVEICDLEAWYEISLFEKYTPDAVIHYAEQPSAPYSMQDYYCARGTLENNIMTTFNVIHGVLKHCPNCHIIKLGSMGEYGTPNCDIPEGWMELEGGDKRLFPREGSSLYHTTKIMDTDLLYFYTRTYGLRVTDLMQGIVYGFSTEETELHPDLATSFYYDDIFGTVLNRFLAQALVGHPLTVYGSGMQVRSFLDIRDTLQCVELALNTPAEPGSFRVFNQFTSVVTVFGLAHMIKVVADGQLEHIDNPRLESEAHQYNPQKGGLYDLGLKRRPIAPAAIKKMLDKLRPYKDRIDTSKILPTVSWNTKNLKERE